MVSATIPAQLSGAVNLQIESARRRPGRKIRHVALPTGRTAATVHRPRRSPERAIRGRISARPIIKRAQRSVYWLKTKKPGPLPVVQAASLAA